MIDTRGKEPESIRKIISKRKFNFLSNYSENSLTEEEKIQVKKYKETKIEEVKSNPVYKVKEDPKRKPITSIPVKILAKNFKIVWEKNEGKELIIDQARKPIYRAVCEYFSKSSVFEQTTVTENVPSLTKGILLIGDHGCGKTSMINAFHEIGRRMLPDTFLWFATKSCNSMVLDYEKIEKNKEKESFLQKNICVKNIFFDDFGTEHIASNYGKKNIIKEVLEERYVRKKTTHLTTNLSLEEIEKKYGGRVFDRIQEMFNVIIMPGGSFRR